MSSVWPVLHYDDARGALRFLVDVLGFEEVVAAEDEDGDLVHVELSRPGGGALVFGSTKHTGGVHEAMRPGTAACYVVADDVDAVEERVRRADPGAVVQPAGETRFGTGGPVRAFTARDPEGNLWTFGTYRGAARTPGRIKA